MPWLGAFELDQHEREAGENQGDGGGVDGQQIEPEEREHEQQGAECAGNDGAGHVELCIEEEDAGEQEQDGEVGVGQGR